METPTKLAGFALGVVVVFGGAAGIGAAVGPLSANSTDEMAEHGTDAGSGHDDTHAGEPVGTDVTDAEELPGGLMISQHGYNLDLEQSRLASTDNTSLRFRILGPDGEPVTEYTEEHGKRLHLIVVRRDMSGYQHVHPTLDDTGEWSVPLDLGEPGDYRVFADFAPAGAEPLTLGADLSVAGTYAPQPLPESVRSVEVDGYTVELDGTLVPGEQSKLTLTVSKDGAPVTDLEPYLEAYGHLVALRDGDLAYLHVHPDGSPGDGKTQSGPEITFYAKTPSAGAYRLFLDFLHEGKVRTAEFTAVAAVDGESAEAGDAEGHEEVDESEHAH